MKAFIEAGAAAVHFEDQLSSEKKCGHLGGKVLVPTSQFVRTLVAARLAADVLDVPTLVVARTDALSAALLTSDVDEVDAEFCTGERTPEGFFRVRDGLDAAIARGLAYAPVRRSRLVRDLDARPGEAEAVRRRRCTSATPASCSRTTARRRSTGAATCPTRRSPTFQRDARPPRLPLPVRHARRLPRAQRRHVRARPRLPRRGDDRVRPAAGARVRARGRRATRRPATSARSAPATSTRCSRRSPAAAASTLALTRLDRRGAVRRGKECGMTSTSIAIGTPHMKVHGFSGDHLTRALRGRGLYGRRPRARRLRAARVPEVRLQRVERAASPAG